MAQSYPYSSPIPGRGARETQSSVWPPPAAEDFQGIGSPSSPMQNNSIPRTFPNNTSYLGYPSSSQSHFSLPNQSDILQEFHSPNGSHPFVCPDNVSHSQRRLNQEPPWNHLQASPPKPQSELLDDTNPPFPKKRKLNGLDPEPLQYSHGPTSDSGYHTLSDYSPGGFPMSEHGTKLQDQSIPEYMQQYDPSTEDKYYCSSTGDPQNELGNDFSQSVPLPTCDSSVDNEPRNLQCNWEDCKWTGKCDSEYKKHQKQHTRPFKCDISGCDNQKGFPTLNDLERHKHSKHGIQTEGNRPKYKDCRCFVPGCPKAEHVFKRADNFKAHIKRMHPDEDVEKIMKLSEDFYHQQQQEQRRRKEIGARGNVLQQPVSLENAIEPDTLAGGEWNNSAEINQLRYIDLRGPPLLPMQHRSRHLTQSTRPQLSTCNLNLPSEAVNLKHLQRTTSPSQHDDPKTAYVSHKGSITQSVDHAPPPLSMPDMLSRKAPPFTSNVSSAKHKPQDMQPEGGPSDLPRDAQSDKQNPPEDTDLQPQSPRVDDPEFLSRLIRKTLGSNPSQTAQDAAADLIRFVRNGLDSLSSANSPRSSDILMGDDNTTISIKPKIPCPRCAQSFTRRCDLKKHLKRHNKPYSCTYPKCRKPFGSKADWKRHENTQHFQLECWQCPKPSQSKGSQNGHCDKLFYRRETFLAHLKGVHQITDEGHLKTLAKDKKIGRGNHQKFWCGFCNESRKLKEKGLRGVDERFDHLEKHFLDPEGRGLEGWVNQPEGVPGNDDEEILIPESESDTGSGSGSSEEEEGDGAEEMQLASSSRAMQPRLIDSSVAFDTTRSVSKNGKTPKRTRIVESCCECSVGQYLLALTTGCPICQHPACEDCKIATVPLEGQKNDKARAPQIG